MSLINKKAKLVKNKLFILKSILNSLIIKHKEYFVYNNMFFYFKNKSFYKKSTLYKILSGLNIFNKILLFIINIFNIFNIFHQDIILMLLI